MRKEHYVTYPVGTHSIYPLPSGGVWLVQRDQCNIIEAHPKSVDKLIPIVRKVVIKGYVDIEIA